MIQYYKSYHRVVTYLEVAYFLYFIKNHKEQILKKYDKKVIEEILDKYLLHLFLGEVPIDNKYGIEALQSIDFTLILNIYLLLNANTRICSSKPSALHELIQCTAHEFEEYLKVLNMWSNKDLTKIKVLSFQRLYPIWRNPTHPVLNGARGD